MRLLLAAFLFTLPAAVTAKPTPDAPLICVDPGHPSETSDGRWKANGISELDAVWETAVVLEEKLRAAGFRVLKTKRARDEYVTNRDRANVANEAGAALFLRLHCDTGERSGYTLYFPDRPGTKSGVTGPSPEIIARSGVAARAFAAGMAEVLGRSGHRGNGVRGDSATSVGAKQGALTGSIFCAVPSVLVEMANLPHKRDAAFMKDPAKRALMADALVAGVKRALAALAGGSTRGTDPR